MKNILFIALFGILFTSCNTTSTNETRNLESFNKVHLVGNIELHLERNSYHSMEVRANSTSDLAKLTTEVRNGELYIHNACNNCKSSKYIVYLNHSGISDIAMTGKIKLILHDEISQKDLVIKGNGILTGNVEASVKNLQVDLTGISNMTISGYADTSNLKLTGIGRINASDLNTKSGKKVSNGIAFIHR